MLMDCCIHTGRHSDTIGGVNLAFGGHACGQDAAQLRLEVDGAILVEVIAQDVLTG